jgi:hypothetical protein
MKFVGCKKAKEISATRDPAQPRASLLIKRTAPVQPENDDMDIEIAKRLVSMPDVTKNHFASLEGEAAKAFLAKPAAEQDAEAEAAKKKADDEAAAKTAAEEAAKTVQADSSEAVKALGGQVTELQKTLDKERREREVEKMARSKDFDGYPGGESEVVKQLNIAFDAGGAAKDAIIEGMKSRAEMAKTMGQERGSRSEADILRGAPRSSEVMKEAQRRAEENKTSEAIELAKMGEEPAWKQKVYEASEEMVAA